jgi:hypothetical protein
MDIENVLPELPVHETLNWTLERMVVKITLSRYRVVNMAHRRCQGKAGSQTRLEI